MRSSTFSRVLVILALAVVIGGGIGYWASRHPEPRENSERVKPSPVFAEKNKTPATNFSAAAPTSLVSSPAPEMTQTNADETKSWEDKLDEILTSDTDPAKKGDELLDLMPTVGEEAQVELAGHIINLVADTNYARVAPYLTNAAVPEAVSSVFMSDLYNRANSLKLPMVLAVARNEQHPLREQATDLLQLYLEEDHGTDWGKWETTMNAWLKEHPDEEP